MTFFESLLALLLAAIALLQVSRRFGLPYPALLAAAGLGVAFIPGAPDIHFDAHTALALFIAPVLVDAAFDFPVGVVQRLWRPLFVLAVVAVLVTAALVAWIGWASGLPLAAALALGAIVSPPDAAAAVAVLGTVTMPRSSTAVLKGESLLNDATALLLFTAAVEVQGHGGFDGTIALHMAEAVPGGILLGFLFALAMQRIMPHLSGSLGGNLLEFVGAFGVWIVAERLGLSAVLCVVTFAMTIARTSAQRQRPRVRVHSFAVWESVTFLLNVFAFLLMGMQARTIVGGMEPERLLVAARTAGLVVLAVIGARLVLMIVWNRLAARFSALRGDYPPASLGQGVLVGWAGMRGLLTLATSFALPGDFPQRDLIVLTAFAVVVATLVVQGLTLAPLTRLLGLDCDDGAADEMEGARHRLAEAAATAIAHDAGPEADHLRYGFHLVARATADDAADEAPLERHRELALLAIRAERKLLAQLRATHAIGLEVFEKLQEELDWKELATQAEEDRRIEAV